MFAPGYPNPRCSGDFEQSHQNAAKDHWRISVGVSVPLPSPARKTGRPNRSPAEFSHAFASIRGCRTEFECGARPRSAWASTSARRTPLRDAPRCCSIDRPRPGGVEGLGPYVQEAAGRRPAERPIPRRPASSSVSEADSPNALDDPFSQGPNRENETAQVNRGLRDCRWAGSSVG